MKLYKIKNWLTLTILKNSGSATIFFVVTVMPTLLLVATLTIDLSAYYYKRRELQQHIDEAVKLGAQFLPDQKTAENVVKESLKKLPNTNYQVTVDEREVLVSAGVNTIPMFVKFFLKSLHITPNVYSLARFPLRNILVIQDGSTHAFPPEGERIGNEMISNYIKSNFSSTTDTLSLGISFQSRCYNRVFNAIKHFTLNLLYNLRGNAAFNISVAQFPGQGMKSLSAGGTSKEGPLFEHDQSIRQIKSDSLCKEIAKSDPYNRNFSLPERYNVYETGSFSYSNSYQEIWHSAISEHGIFSLAEVYQRGTSRLLQIQNTRERGMLDLIVITPSVPDLEQHSFHNELRTVVQELLKLFGSNQYSVNIYTLFLQKEIDLEHQETTRKKFEKINRVLLSYNSKNLKFKNFFITNFDQSLHDAAHAMLKNLSRTVVVK
jgi:hypothetical protein